MKNIYLGEAGMKDTQSNSRNVYLFLIVFAVGGITAIGSEPGNIRLSVEQLTSGTKHHFFGYIGQCQTIPWNASGRYVLGLEIDRIDRLPTPEEFATVILVDTRHDNKFIRLDKCHAWNPQQGTMFYWNPLKPETQFFFNDRDIKTGKVFTVLYDIEKNRRVREYKFDDTPVGNGGVAADGSAFLALNYGRLARLRLVTGYPQALDWSKDDIAPEDDGIFIVDIRTGKKRLLVSYRQLEGELKKRRPELDHTGLFINHTLWNRESDRVYFFVRGGWSKTMRDKGDKVNTPCSINADGTGLTLHEQFVGGHPEWDEGNIIIGRDGDRQARYDIEKKKIVGQIGTPEMFPKPEGDISLSPDGNWFVNGYKEGTKNYYAVYRRSDGAFARSEGLDKGSYGGDIRIDPAPRWNRTNDAILVPGIARNKTRQMFVLHVIAPEKYLFILAGQSNMQGMNQKLTFEPRVFEEFGQDNVLIVKEAIGGRPIRMWLHDWAPADDWKVDPNIPGTKPPTKEENGVMYRSMMHKIAAETQGAKPKAIAFCWMQGERDARERHSAVYERSLKQLFSQLKEDFPGIPMVFVIGKLSDFGKDNGQEFYPEWEEVCRAQEKVAADTPNCTIIRTDDLNTGASPPHWKTKKVTQRVDDLHMSANGYKILGSRFAEESIKLLQKVIPQ